MSSPLGRLVGNESISSKLKAVSFETPDPGNIIPESPGDEGLDSQPPGLASVQERLHRKITPKTVAPKVRGIQRERMKQAKDKKALRQLMDSVRSSNSTEDSAIGDTSLKKIVLDLGRNAEDMSSSEIRNNSKGLLAKPSGDDDVFSAPSAQGHNINWMKKHDGREVLNRDSRTQKTPDCPSEDNVPETENETPTRAPKSKNPPKTLGIPLPNFGRFWDTKYNLEEEHSAKVVQMFAQCDPENADQVKQLYELTWLIKVSIAMMQCDIEDQARVQELVHWAQDIKTKDDWQSPVPLGWNLKQQQYIGPIPSEEERQRFVDYAWLMDHTKAKMTWHSEKERKFKKAVAVVNAFKDKYPDFPHDYPPGHPGEHPSSHDGASRIVSRKTSSYTNLPKTRGPRIEDEVPWPLGDNFVEIIGLSRKRKREVDEVKAVAKESRKKTKATAENVTPAEKIRSKDTNNEGLRRSGRNREKGTISYKSS